MQALPGSALDLGDDGDVEAVVEQGGDEVVGEADAVTETDALVGQGTEGGGDVLVELGGGGAEEDGTGVEGAAAVDDEVEAVEMRGDLGGQDVTSLGGGDATAGPGEQRPAGEGLDGPQMVRHGGL